MVQSAYGVSEICSTCGQPDNCGDCTHSLPPALGDFFVDEGALYRLYPVEGVQVARGLNTGTTYTSTATSVEVTGKVRNHGLRIGFGHRAVLHLDTGEGIVALRGVFRKET